MGQKVRVDRIRGPGLGERGLSRPRSKPSIMQEDRGFESWLE